MAGLVEIIFFRPRYLRTLPLCLSNACFVLNLLQLPLCLCGLSTPSFLTLAQGLAKLEGPWFPVIHFMPKDDDDNNNDVMYDTQLCNLSVQFIEACCMSWLLLLYVLSAIAFSPPWSKQAMSSMSWSSHSIAGWNIHILGAQDQNDILPWIHSCPLLNLCRHSPIFIQSGPV